MSNSRTELEKLKEEALAIINDPETRKRSEQMHRKIVTGWNRHLLDLLTKPPRRPAILR